MNLFKKLKNYFFKNCFPFNIECPVCKEYYMNNNINIDCVSAKVYNLKNEKTKKINYYIKCDMCNTTTPAFPSIKEVETQWEFLWSKLEDKIFMKDED